MKKRRRLSYLKNTIPAKNASYYLYTCHKILGHCNEYDIKKLPISVNGMKIQPTQHYIRNCDICIQIKITENESKTLHEKITEIL